MDEEIKREITNRIIARYPRNYTMPSKEEWLWIKHNGWIEIKILGYTTGGGDLWFSYNEPLPNGVEHNGKSG